MSTNAVAKMRTLVRFLIEPDHLLERVAADHFGPDHVAPDCRDASMQMERLQPYRTHLPVPEVNKEISTEEIPWAEGALMDARATTDDDVKAIKNVGQEFFAGVNTADLDKRIATMDPDIVIMPPDRPSIVGKDKIRRLSQDYSAAFEEKCSLVYDEVKSMGQWGFAWATVTGTRTSKLGGGVETVSLKNLWIVKRRADGEWKFWRIMFNSNPLNQQQWNFHFQVFSA